MRYILVVGSRNFNNYTLLSDYLDKKFQGARDITIVSGGAKGADHLAKLYAKYRNLNYIEFPAKWNVYGKRAGYIRNEEMHKFIAGHKERQVIAFWDGQSKGTAHNFPLSEKYKNPIEIVKYAE